MCANVSLFLHLEAFAEPRLQSLAGRFRRHLHGSNHSDKFGSHVELHKALHGTAHLVSNFDSLEQRSANLYETSKTGPDFFFVTLHLLQAPLQCCKPVTDLEQNFTEVKRSGGERTKWKWRTIPPVALRCFEHV